MKTIKTSLVEVGKNYIINKGYKWLKINNRNPYNMRKNWNRVRWNKYYTKLCKKFFLRTKFSKNKRINKKLHNIYRWGILGPRVINNMCRKLIKAKKYIGVGR